MPPPFSGESVAGRYPHAGSIGIGEYVVYSEILLTLHTKKSAIVCYPYAEIAGSGRKAVFGSA